MGLKTGSNIDIISTHISHFVYLLPPKRPQAYGGQGYLMEGTLSMKIVNSADSHWNRRVTCREHVSG